MSRRIYTRVISLLSTDRFHFAVVMGFALATGIISWMVMPKGGIDIRSDILPSLWNWRAPWVEGTPLFPWATIILMPLRFFSPRVATAIINSLSIVIIAFLIKRFNGNVLNVIPVMFSPIGYRLITTGQTDAIILAAIFLPAGLDLLLFWKPQVIAHIFWVRGLAQPKIYLVSGMSILLISWLIWGFWPKAVLEFGQTQLIGGWWNFSLWPYSIPIGMLMVYFSIKEKDVSYGIIASPLLFPYVNGPSYIGLIAVVAAKWPKFFWLSGVIILLYMYLEIFMPGLNLPRLY